MEQPSTRVEITEELLRKLQDYTPTIPDEVTAYYLNKSGFNTNDVRLKRLISLATQKFISDIANDSLQYCKIRQTVGTSKKDKKLVLTMDDVIQTGKEYGIQIKKPEYYADRSSTATTTQEKT